MLTSILIAVIVLLSAALTVCIILLVRRKKRADALRKAIAESLQNGSPMAYSLHDDRFSMLENEVADLSVQLAHEKENAHKLIYENNAFLADVSHQLKTPLAGIRLYCEMVQQAGHADIAGYTQKQLILLERTDKLVSDLLRLEKLRSDYYRPAIKEARIEDLCRSVFGNLRPMYPHKNFSLQGVAVLRCDRSYLHEAIENIVKNACEHTKEDGCIEIEISKGESCVFITVQDDGGGLPEADRSRLFERFYRAPGTKSNGTGLGLAITKAIVERHHGTVSVQNRDNGLRFTLCLPISQGMLKVEEL